jgi:hypothetical protein
LGPGGPGGPGHRMSPGEDLNDGFDITKSSQMIFWMPKHLTYAKRMQMGSSCAFFLRMVSWNGSCCDSR